MKRLLVGILLLALLPTVVFAGDISLPKDMNASASVRIGERAGLWEKTLIIRFPDKRRTLTTTDGAMARALITITEAKTAAFEDLRIPSSYTKTVQATGTGTDSIIVATGTAWPKVTYTGGHNRIGELIGKAVYEAVIEALGKQNGFKKGATK